MEKSTGRPKSQNEGDRMMFWVFLLAYLVAGVLVQPVYAAPVDDEY